MSSKLPETRIVLAPPGAGKTEYALQQLCATLDGPGWPRVWVLLPNEWQQAAFRQRLLTRAEGRQAVFNVRLFGFGALAQELLHMAGRPQRVLAEVERQGVLRAALAELAREGALQVFGDIADTPGFVRAIGQFLDALRQNLVTPEAFAAAARSARDQELAQVAMCYRALLLRAGDQDPAGVHCLAREALGAAPLRGELAQVTLLLVDGFDQFTALQAAMLMQLAGCVRRALITLPDAPGREHPVAEAFRQTLTTLREHSPQPLQVDPLPLRPAARDELQPLRARLFRPDAQSLPQQRGLQLVEAPGPRQEALAITRRIRHLLLEGDARPEDCLVALRDWPRYAGQLHVAARAHGVPLAFARGEPLTSVPSILYLLRLLQLAGADFPRQELLEVLRAPCFALPGLAPEQVTQLERIGLHRRLRGGREAWLMAVRASDLAGREALARALRDFMDAVTPPAGSVQAGLPHWLRRLCGLGAGVNAREYTLNMRDCLAADLPGDLRAREAAALEALDALLRRMSGARQDFAAFRRELQAALETTRLAGPPLSAGAVPVVEATMARGLPHRHVFIPGLSAGIFPAQSPRNPLHLGSELDALAGRGVKLAGRPTPGDDALFHQLLGQARASLMLTRPAVENGAPLVASHLWQALREACPAQPVRRIHSAALPAVREVASLEEAQVVLAADPDAVTSARLRLRLRLRREQAGLLAQVTRARRVEQARLARERYAGTLEAPHLIDEVAAQLGPARVWSASQLNELGACRYRFFAARLLQLEALQAPEPGLDALQLGALNHEILERTYREIEARGLSIEPQHLDEARAILNAVAQDVLERAPQEHALMDDGLWARESAFLRSRLESFLRRDFSADSPVGYRLAAAPRRARWQEQRFGGQDDPFSIPLRIDGRREQLRLRGIIDRMDEADGRVLVIDYKSGSTKITDADVREGVNVQMVVYFQAAQHLLARLAPGRQLAGGFFLHLRGVPGISGSLQPNERDEQLMRAAEDRIGEHIAAARRGDFSAQPRRPQQDGRCRSYCEFSQLCRVTSGREATSEAGG